jgi:hypothetical protein
VIGGTAEAGIRANHEEMILFITAAKSGEFKTYKKNRKEKESDT